MTREQILARLAYLDQLCSWSKPSKPPSKPYAPEQHL